MMPLLSVLFILWALTFTVWLSAGRRLKTRLLRLMRPASIWGRGRL